MGTDGKNVREPIIKKPPSRRPFYNLPEYRPEARTTKRRHRCHKTAPRHTTHIKVTEHASIHIRGIACTSPRICPGKTTDID